VLSAWALVASVAVLAAVLAEKLLLIGLQPPWLIPLILFGAAAAGSLLVAGATGVHRRQAELVLDREAGLLERVSSAGEIIAGGAATSMSPLVVEDASRRVEDVDPRQVVPIVMPRLLRWIAAPLLLAVLVTVLMPDFDLLSRGVEKRLAEHERAEEKRIAKEMEKVANELSEIPTISGLDTPQKMSDRLEELSRQLDRGRLPRQQGALELSKIADDLAEQVERGEQDRSRMQSLKRMNRSAAAEGSSERELAAVEDAMASGELDKAADALRELAENMKRELSEEGLGDAEREAKRKLMSKELSDLAKKLGDKDDPLAKKLEDAASALDGDEDALDRLGEELSKAADDLGAMQKRLDDLDRIQASEREISEMMRDMIASDSCSSCGEYLSEHGEESACSGSGKGGQPGQKGIGDKGEGEGAGKGARGEGQGLGMGGEGEGELGRALPGRLERAEGNVRPRPSVLQPPRDAGGGQGVGDGTGGEGRGRGGDPGESGASGTFVDEQVQAIGYNRGIIIARQIKYGLPGDPGELELEASGTSATILGELEEALEEEGIPREHRERTKTYYDFLKGQTEAGGGR